MSLAEIEQAALDLPERDRATLVAALLDTLAPVDAGVTDEEVLEREQDLEAGRVEALSHEEFVRRVERERGQ